MILYFILYRFRPWSDHTDSSKVIASQLGVKENSVFSKDGAALALLPKKQRGKIMRGCH